MVQSLARYPQLHVMIAFAGVFAVAAYVLFGDSFQSVTPAKKKRKRGGLPGLVNIGNSCFINCILQALASSVAYNNWLATHDAKYTKRLVIAVRNILQRLNDESDEDTTAMEVLSALKDQKLFMSAGEQDAHELFIALISAINDELTNAQQESLSLLEIGWASPSDRHLSPQLPKSPQITLANGKTFNDVNYLGNESYSDVPLESEQSMVCEVAPNEFLEQNLLEDCLVNSDNVNPSVKSACKNLANSSSDALHGSPPFSENSRIVTRVSTALNQEAKHCKIVGQRDCPFSGSLASQLQCMFCGCKNPDQWTPFHAISLCFPTPQSASPQFRLEDLLEIYIKKEIIELNCEKCSKNSNTRFSKQLTFGKLPECLCIHIQRNVWTCTGATVKLRDRVVVPEVIDMEPFTYSNNLRKQQKVEAANFSNNIKCQPISINEALQAISSIQSELVAETDSFRGNNIYKLQAVVVHVGDAHSGHFVTYRRGSINSTFRNRWFYTSDSVVSEVSLEQVLNSNAYMILYEKLV